MDRLIPSARVDSGSVSPAKYRSFTTCSRHFAVDIRGNALERLVSLYTEWDHSEPGWGHDGKAAEWQGRLSTHRESSAAPPPAK